MQKHDQAVTNEMPRITISYGNMTHLMLPSTLHAAIVDISIHDCFTRITYPMYSYIRTNWQYMYTSKCHCTFQCTVHLHHNTRFHWHETGSNPDHKQHKFWRIQSSETSKESWLKPSNQTENASSSYIYIYTRKIGCNRIISGSNPTIK